MRKGLHRDRLVPRAQAAAFSDSVQRVWVCISEPLEPRRLFAAIEAGVLVARGSEGADVFSLRRTGTDDVIITTNGASQTFDMDDFTGVRFEGLGGSDRVNIIDTLVSRAASPVARNITVLGGDGDDTIVGGGGDELLLGEGGNDSLSGNQGDDTLDGGAGIDTLDGGVDDDALLNGELIPLTPRIRIADRILFADDTWGGADVSIARVGLDDVIVRIDNFSRQFDMDDFDGVLLRGNKGYDRITIDGSLGPIPGVTLDGGNGNDTLRADDGVGDDTILGGDGTDTARIDAGDGTSGIETFT